MALLADLTISTDTLAVCSVVIGTLWSALVVMWRLDTQRRDAREADLEHQVHDLVRVMIERGLRDAIPQCVPASKIPPRVNGGP